MFMKFIAAILVLAGIPTLLLAQDSGFSWVDTEGEYMDLLYNGKKTVRYVYERMDPENREATYKPFHQVYNAEGTDFITKGAGGKFTHHRGIYFGFSKCKFTTPDGKEANVDSWHCKRAYQTHEEVLESAAGEDSAMHKLRIHWQTDEGLVFIKEERQMTFAPLEGGVMVDFNSTLSTDLDEVVLDGDPQHAGFHFRASNEVNDETAGQTYYIRPKSGKGEPGKTINWNKNDEDLKVTNVPWKAMSFVVGGERYTVLYLDHPSNPKPARYSERPYGRFGSYFVSAVNPESSLSVQYRLHIRKGEMTAEECEKLHAEWLAP